MLCLFYVRYRAEFTQFLWKGEWLFVKKNNHSLFFFLLQRFHSYVSFLNDRPKRKMAQKEMVP